VGHINTVGPVTPGDMTIATATPVLKSTAACNPCIVIDNTSPLTTGGALINGSSITVGAVQQMSLETGQLQSSGGTITVTAGANARVVAASSPGVFGVHGTVAITTNSPTPFVVGGPGTTTNGVVLPIQVFTAHGPGGTISITSNGSGGIQIDKPANLQVSQTVPGGGGDGGNINLTANNAPLVIDTSVSNVLRADAQSQSTFGGVTTNGGSITLSGQTVRVTGPSPLVVSANGSNNTVSNTAGNGGTISVTSSNPNADLAIGSGAGQFTVSAKSGTVGTAIANGGSVTFTSGRELNVDVAFLNANPLGTNGKGATYDFTAGSAHTTSGNLHIFDSSSPLDPVLAANGVGSGAGGNITLTSNSPLPFSVGIASENGVQGRVVADGDGGLTGSGGVITINANGTGGILVSSAPAVAPTIGAQGGTTTTGTRGTIPFTNGRTH